MALFMIATIKNGDKIVGVRLLETNEGKTMNVPVSNVTNLLSTGKVKIDNLQVSGGKLKGVNGALERYGVAGVSQSCTILGVFKNGDKVMGYKVADSNGAMRKLTVENTLGIAEFLGIANGKIVNKDGTKFISAIEGEYSELDAVAESKVSKKEVAKTVEESKYPKTLKIVDGKIANAGTGNPICEQGQLAFDKINYYAAGKLVIAEKRQNRDSIIYAYDVEKDEFSVILKGMPSINKVSKITGGLIISYMSTGGYGQFYKTYLALYNSKNKSFSKVSTVENITNSTFIEAGHDELGNVVVYDVALTAIGAFSHGKPRLNLYEVCFDNMSIHPIGNVVVDGKMDDLKWVQFNGNPVDRIEVCMRVGNRFGVMTEDDSWPTVSIAGKQAESIEGYDKLLEMAFGENGNKSIALSNGTDIRRIVVAHTADRGQVVKIGVSEKK